MDKGLKGCWMDVGWMDVGWVDVNECVFDKVENMLMFNDTLSILSKLKYLKWIRLSSRISFI